MIKGVNKKIIEINNLESIYFEKAVFYLRPEVMELPQQVAEEEIERYISRLGISSHRRKSKTKKHYSLITRRNCNYKTKIGGISMIKINTTTNVSANIYVGEAENQKNVAYANASVSKNGDVSINKSIQDGEAFKANKESVLKDFTEFETYVYSLVDTAE